MWEFSLVLEDNNEAKKFFNECKKVLKKHKGVITIFNNEVLFAFKSKMAKNLISETIVYYVLTNYKMKYFTQKLNAVELSDIKRDALIKVLTMFDNEFDIILLTDELKINSFLMLDSFMKFQMKYLIKKWNEIINLIVDNSTYLFCSQSYNDLLKFLVNTLDSKQKEVNVVFKEDKLFVFDRTFKNCLIKNSDSRIILTELIGFSPQKINIYCSNIVDNPIFNLILDIFQEKVKIISNN